MDVIIIRFIACRRAEDPEFGYLERLSVGRPLVEVTQFAQQIREKSIATLEDTDGLNRLVDVSGNQVSVDILGNLLDAILEKRKWKINDPRRPRRPRRPRPRSTKPQS